MSSSEVLQPLAYNAYGLDIYKVWAIPVSLATTQGIAIAFYSCRY